MPLTFHKIISFRLEITNLLNKNHRCVYVGFDPTADSVHVDNLLVIVSLLHWQRGGHQVFLIFDLDRFI